MGNPAACCIDCCLERLHRFTNQGLVTRIREETAFCLWNVVPGNVPQDLGTQLGDALPSDGGSSHNRQVTREHRQR